MIYIIAVSLMLTLYSEDKRCDSTITLVETRIVLQSEDDNDELRRLQAASGHVHRIAPAPQ